MDVILGIEARVRNFNKNHYMTKLIVAFAIAIVVPVVVVRYTTPHINIIGHIFSFRRSRARTHGSPFQIYTILYRT